MSYAKMDHAEWMESNHAAERRINAELAAKGKKPRYKGAPAEPLSEFQKAVCDILGITFGGIYNVPASWNKAEWTPRYVTLVVCKSLGTFDFREMTMLTLACHAARIRCEVSAASRNYLRLIFHPRVSARDQGMGRYHPNIEEAVAAFREYVPPDHRIFKHGESV